MHDYDDSIAFATGYLVAEMVLAGLIFRGMNIRGMMPRWLRNWWKLRELKRREEKLDAMGEPFLKESHEKNDSNIIDNWYDSHQWEYDSIYWSRKELVSNALLEEADRLYLPRPQYSDKTKWEEADEYTDNPGQRVLTPEAMAELRATIRKERRERRENIEFYIKLMGGIIAIATGLVGALIGLVSTWNHK